MCNAWNHPVGCRCGFGEGDYCGDDGLGGSRSASFPAEELRVRAWPPDQNDEVCRPTKCPRCGANVFFVRHNGGSVWLDSLGWPWPKHPCFAKDAWDRTLAGTFRDCGIKRGARVGVVTAVAPNDESVWLVVHVLAGADIAVEIRRGTGAEGLPVGSLVVLELKYEPQMASFIYTAVGVDVGVGTLKVIKGKKLVHSYFITAWRPAPAPA